MGVIESEKKQLEKIIQELKSNNNTLQTEVSSKTKEVNDGKAKND